MSLYAYQLSFTDPLHIGVEAIGQERILETVHSDTLWGALVQMWSRLFPETPAQLRESRTFRLSSCFPYIQGQRFYPLPLFARQDLAAELAAQDGTAELRFKEIKKIAYINETLLRKLLAGKPLRLQDLQDPDAPASHFPRLGKAASPLAKQQQRPRLAIDRLTNSVQEGTFFYCSDLYFNEQSGLFFLLECPDETQRMRFDAALRLLGDTGLGADRSVGRGCFRFSVQQADFPVPQEENAYLLLSLCHPTREEVVTDKVLENATYGLIRRSGHAAAPAVANLRRPDLWMLTEGSVFQKQITGDIPELIPKGELAPHPVFRYGLALTLPMAGRQTK